MGMASVRLFRKRTDLVEVPMVFVEYEEGTTPRKRTLGNARSLWVCQRCRAVPNEYGDCRCADRQAGGGGST